MIILYDFIIYLNVFPPYPTILELFFGASSLHNHSSLEAEKNEWLDTLYRLCKKHCCKQKKLKYKMIEINVKNEIHNTF